MKILVVVDMQRDFIDGVLGTAEAQAIVPKVIEKINQYNAHNEPVIYTMDTHFEHSYPTTIEGQKLPVTHCIYGTYGWEIPPEIRMGSPDVIHKYSFGSTSLPERILRFMSHRDVTAVEIIGLCTDICVISNAMVLKTFVYEVPIIVDSSCCAGTTPESHQRALDAMKMCHIDIV